MIFQSFVRLKSKCLCALCTHDFVIVAPPEALVHCMTLVAILLIVITSCRLVTLPRIVGECARAVLYFTLGGCRWFRMT